jgi:hypothetical protein
MIVSASRRTDLPALYPKWLGRRLEAGHAVVPHPFDPSKLRRVDLRPAPRGDLGALVLWTRNPGPILSSVPSWESRGIRSLWLVTVTAYPGVLEPKAPPTDLALRSIRELARIVGPKRVAWRYDPIFVCAAQGLDSSWHLHNFQGLAHRLAGAAGRCIVSVYDPYAKTRRRLREAGAEPDAAADLQAIAGEYLRVAAEVGMEMRTCCEDLAGAGVPAGACIDGEFLDDLWNLGIGGRRDPGQRPGCRCAPSVDIGVYDTCTHGCLYCYATGRPERARSRRRSHRPDSESLI